MEGWRQDVPLKRRFLQDVRHNIPEGGIIHSQRRENLESYIFLHRLQPLLVLLYATCTYTRD
jgi:hypothetical protein